MAKEDRYMKMEGRVTCKGGRRQGEVKEGKKCMGMGVEEDWKEGQGRQVDGELGKEGGGEEL